MKWLLWMLPLAMMLMFAMPVMASDSGPPGDIAAFLAMDDSLTPVPVLEAQDSLLTPLLAGFSGSPLNSAYESQHQVGATANNDPMIPRLRPDPLLLTRINIDAAMPQLRHPVGGVAHSHCTKTGLHQHPLQA